MSEAKDKLTVSFNREKDNTREKLSFDFVYDPDFPNEVHPCLWGDINGEYIQIDFNDLTIEEWSNFKKYVNRVDKLIKANKPTSNIKEEFNSKQFKTK